MLQHSQNTRIATGSELRGAERKDSGACWDLWTRHLLPHKGWESLVCYFSV